MSPDSPLLGRTALLPITATTIGDPKGENGGGENRTPVLEASTLAFYILSRCFVSYSTCSQIQKALSQPFLSRNGTKGMSVAILH